MREPSFEYEVAPDTGCWEWSKGRTTAGYGETWDGRTVLLAHRLSYERHVGPIPEGLQIDHLCRNRGCVNPAHLEVVTSGENSRRGERAKLTWAKVREIRAMVGTVPNYVLAERFGVSRPTISSVRHHRTWMEGT